MRPNPLPSPLFFIRSGLSEVHRVRVGFEVGPADLFCSAKTFASGSVCQSPIMVRHGLRSEVGCGPSSDSPDARVFKLGCV